MRKRKALKLFILLISIVLLWACKEEVLEPTLELPEITTEAVTTIRSYTAISGGNISSDGGSSIEARGVCWNTNPEPTLSDNFSQNGSIGKGIYESIISGLSPSTTYFVRAYAINEKGTAYGNEIEFNTSQVTFAIPYGGSQPDWANSIKTTDDGGYVFAGRTASNDGDVSLNQGYYDIWVVKLKSNGSIDWQKSLGGSGEDYASAIQETTDGGYIVVGNTFSNDGDVSGNHGDSDFWVVKLNSDGSINWQKCLGGSNEDLAYLIQETADGGYIVSGSTSSDDGDVSGFKGTSDYWIVKLNGEGNIIWQKCLGGPLRDIEARILETNDGNFVVAGNSYSNSGDVSFNYGYSDFWLVKLNSDGNIIWERSYGGSDYDIARAIQETAEGGYIIAGGSYSTDGYVGGNYGDDDYWVIKLNRDGEVHWKKNLGGSNSDMAYSIQESLTGGYYVAGGSYSNDGDIRDNNGDSDYWIVKLNSEGSITWQRSYGGSDFDRAESIQETADGGCIIAGLSRSTDGDVKGNNGSVDCWVVKLDASGNLIDN